MCTIELPTDVEAALANVASQAGTTVQSLAVETLRKTFLGDGSPTEPPQGKRSLAEALGDFVGYCDGPEGNWSENTGKHFGDLLEQDYARQQAQQ